MNNEKKTIVVIGLCRDNLLLGGGFCDGLREQFNLYVISADLEYPWRINGYKTQEEWIMANNPHPNYDFHIFSAKKTWGGYCESQDHAKAIQYGWNPMDIREILESHNVYPDAILLTPTQDIVCDFTNIPENIPVYYYFLGAVCWPRWPMNAHVRGFFYGYGEAPRTFKDIFPVEYHHLDFATFVPNAYSAKVWYPKQVDRLEDKKHFLGFMGKMDFDRDTFFSRQLYKNRQKYVKYLQKKFALNFQGFRPVDQCREFLQDTFLGLNVAAFGVNMRQFEVPACGALLLQHENQDSARTGLVDRQNCLLFKNLNELDEQVEWAFSHTSEADEIRLNGIQYAQKNTFYHRGVQIADALNTHLTLLKSKETGTGTGTLPSIPLVINPD